MALGLLAGVVLSMAGLVVVGNRWVVGGRNSSEASALAADVVERLESVAFRDLWGSFGCASSAAVCDVADGHAGLAVWRARAAERLPSGRVALRFVSLGASTLGAAPGVRIEVGVRWSEGRRAREMRLVRVRS